MQEIGHCQRCTRTMYILDDFFLPNLRTRIITELILLNELSSDYFKQHNTTNEPNCIHLYLCRIKPRLSNARIVPRGT